MSTLSETVTDALTTNGTFSLANILDSNDEHLAHPGIKPDIPAEGWDEEQIEKEVAAGYCIECEGACSQPPFLLHVYAIVSLNL